MIERLYLKAKMWIRTLCNDPKFAFRQLASLKKPPLFLFQMGKVGSKSHESTLNGYYYVRHFHDKSEFEYAYKTGIKLYSQDTDRPYEVVTCIRDPIARKISVFFQNLVEPSPYRFAYATREEAKQADITELIVKFREWKDGVEEATNWFDKQFEPTLNVDLYSREFDTNKGWSILDSGYFRILLLRFEDINKNHVEAMNELVSQRFEHKYLIREVRRSNLSSKKWYGKKMQMLKREIEFSRLELDEAYESKYMKHFYSASEIGQMRALWKEK